jgi:hypothetical protein
LALSPTSSHGPSGITSGEGSPNGVVTSAGAGDLYRDTYDAGVYVYVGVGAGWAQLGGYSDGGNVTDDGNPVGVSLSTNFSRLFADAGKAVVVSDSAAASNSGNGFYWNSLRGADGEQVADIFTGSAGQFVNRFDAKGHMRPSTLVLTNHAAPADADLAAGDCALWFDQTNGAAKLMIKGKSANGTVVTGTVALA